MQVKSEEIPTKKQNWGLQLLISQTGSDLENKICQSICPSLQSTNIPPGTALNKQTNAKPHIDIDMQFRSEYAILVD